MTGATGRHGNTGLVVARELRARGVPVRALVRHIDERCATIEETGASLVVGDLNERRSLVAALEGIESAYFSFPVSPGIVAAAANFASAGRETGLQRVVVNSMAPAMPESPSPLGRAQWLAEQIMEWSGVQRIVMRTAAFFMENLVLLHGRSLREEGVLRTSFGDSPMNWIAAEDVGRLAAALLVGPLEELDCDVFYPTGTARHTFPEVLTVLSKQLGRKLRLERLKPEEWARELAALSCHEAAINESMIEHITTLSVALSKRPSPPLNDWVERATGRPATDLAQFARLHRSALGGSV